MKNEGCIGARGAASHGQNHPWDHESDAAERLFEKQAKDRPQIAGCQEERKDVRMIASERTRASIGVRRGSISVYTSNSSAVGRLRKVINETLLKLTKNDLQELEKIVGCDAQNGAPEMPIQ